MSRLSIHAEDCFSRPQATKPLLESVDPTVITFELQSRGIDFERWPTPIDLKEKASEASILSAYSEEIAHVQSEGRYPTVDAIRMTPEHPQREELRQKFLAEHTHAEDEVRFFVEGRGLFCLHIKQEVLLVLCEKNDLISVPAGTRHWFDMGSKPQFCALRFFNNPEGWIANFTGDSIATKFLKAFDLDQMI